MKVLDSEATLSNDLIGYTKIDLKKIFFTDNWPNLIYKPVEISPPLNIKFVYFRS
jgi:hypothetical protein